MSALWIKNGLVLTGGRQSRVFSGGVLCQDGAISAVGPDAELLRLAGEAEVIDAGGRLVTPGFINAHMHLYSTLARGMGLKDPPPADFVQILERLWWRLDKVLTLDDLRPSAELPLMDALRAGVTTIIDHHASPGAVEGSLDVLADTALGLGLRFCTCYEVSDRDGPAVMQAGIDENLRFAARARSEPLLAAMFGLHASFTLADESLAACARAASDARLPFHVHVAEASSDAADARERGFDGPLARLHDLGAMTRGSLAVHCVHTTEDEWRRLVDCGAYAVINPQSNMNNAVGATPFEGMAAAGVQVGLGTDGMEADVREEARAAFLMGHHRTADPRTMWAETAALLATNTRIASGLFDCTLGELSVGAAADVVVFDYFPPTEISADNFLGHFLFGLYKAPAHTTVVAGVPRLRRGEIVGVDPAEVAARARSQAERLWQRF